VGDDGIMQRRRIRADVAFPLLEFLVAHLNYTEINFALSIRTLK